MRGLAIIDSSEDLVFSHSAPLMQQDDEAGVGEIGKIKVLFYSVVYRRLTCRI